MVYKLQNLLSDCITSRTRIHVEGDDKVRVYKDLWGALTGWIKAGYTKRKTVNIPLFARFGWKVVESNGQLALEPHFALTEGFLRSNSMPKPRVLREPFLTKFDEYNVITIAIKFSEKLNKDLVFCGTKDLVQRIGRVIASGAPFDIDMGIGRLHGKERKYNFIFDPSIRDQVIRTRPITPDLAAAYRLSSGLGGAQGQEPRRPPSPDYRTMALEGMMPEGEVPESLPTPPIHPSVPNLRLTRDASTGKIIKAPAPEDEPYPDPVVEDAYERYRKSLAKQMKVDSDYAKKYDDISVKFSQEIVEKRLRREKEKLELRSFLDKQVAEERARKEAEIADRKANYFSTGGKALPTLTKRMPRGLVTDAPPGKSDEDEVKDLSMKLATKVVRSDLDKEIFEEGIAKATIAAKARQELKDALEVQLEEAEEDIRAQKEIAREQEARFITHIKGALIADAEEKVAKKVQAKAAMTESWDRELIIKEQDKIDERRLLKKRQERMLADTVKRALVLRDNPDLKTLKLAKGKLPVGQLAAKEQVTGIGKAKLGLMGMDPFGAKTSKKSTKRSSSTKRSTSRSRRSSTGRIPRSAKHTSRFQSGMMPPIAPSRGFAGKSAGSVGGGFGSSLSHARSTPSILEPVGEYTHTHLKRTV